MIRYSVVVPAYNAAADLKACLDAIFTSMPPGGEVIVSDDGSSDETRSIARLYDVKLVSGMNQGPSVARNRGVAATEGTILVFLDSDVVAGPQTILQLVTTLEQSPGLAAVFGAYDDTPFHRGTLTEFRNLLHHYTHLKGKREAITFWTGCGAMRRDWFEKVGGFDKGLRAIEDVDLGLRVHDAGGKILLAPEIQAKHRKRWTLGSMVRTDITIRAIPWMQVMAKRRGLNNDLNTKWQDRACAVFVVLGTMLLWRREGWLLLAAATLLRGDWHLFLVRKRGFWFALRAMPLHWLYLGYSAAAFGYMKLRGY